MRLNIKLGLILSLLFLLLSFKPIFAVVSPYEVENNYFGIHISDENDLEDAAKLVNSQGGKWGYVTVVIQDSDRNYDKWQNLFDKMRRLKLIPLVRIATHPQRDNWTKPTTEDANIWADFLNSLNWVTKNRYVILFNEPNHSKEWGGQISPSEYANIVKSFRGALKARSNDFFILSAGFDMAAGNSRLTMDAQKYFDQMYQSDKEVFKLFDGWSSHSYPNPNFSADPKDEGRTSIKSFTAELDYLKKYEISSNIPVFITETGWVHKDGFKKDSKALDEKTVAEYYKLAYETIWKNPRVVAVTPFIINFPNPPFDHFSWKSIDGNFYPQYETVRALPKPAGKPVQNNDLEIVSAFPEQLIADSNYELDLKVKNKGQTIWYEGDLVPILIHSLPSGSVFIEKSPYTEPGQECIIKVHLKTEDKIKSEKIKLSFLFNNTNIGSSIEQSISLVSPTSLLVKAPLLFKPAINSSGYANIIIYEEDRLVKKIDNVYFDKGVAKVRDLHDVIPEHNYRFVIIKDYYLPSQDYAYLSLEETKVNFPILLPADHDLSGSFSFGDFVAAILHPIRTIGLLLPFK